MAQIECGNITSSSISARVIDLDTSYGDWGVQWRISGNNTSFPGSVSEWVTFDSLEAGTEYTIMAALYRNNYHYDSLSITCSTLSEGGGDSGSGDDEWDWDLWEIISPITETNRLPIEINTLTLYEIIIRFENSGTATFYTEGNVDTVGYLSTSGFWSNGEPVGVLASGDDEGTANNFSFTYDVVAGETYHVWVKSYGGASSGHTDLYIEPPETDTPSPDPPTSWSVADGYIGTVSESYARGFYVNNYTLYRYSVQFTNSGTAVFYAESSIDTYGYLSDTWDSNDEGSAPSAYLTYSDDGEGLDFRFTHEVTAGTWYYVWVKSYNGAYAGQITLHIEPPTVTENPGDFSWTTPKIARQPFKLTPDEWNGLTNAINAKRKKKGLYEYSFTRAVSGYDLTAEIYNQAVRAIWGFGGNAGGNLVEVVTGQAVTADCLNALVAEINDIS